MCVVCPRAIGCDCNRVTSVIREALCTYRLYRIDCGEAEEQTCSDCVFLFLTLSFLRFVTLVLSQRALVLHPWPVFFR